MKRMHNLFANLNLSFEEYKKKYGHFDINYALLYLMTHANYTIEHIEEGYEDSFDSYYTIEKPIIYDITL